MVWKFSSTTLFIFTEVIDLFFFFKFSPGIYFYCFSLNFQVCRPIWRKETKVEVFSLDAVVKTGNILFVLKL